MSDEYTPTTEDVRRAYREHCRDYDAIDGLATSHESYEDEFNRWRDNDRAEAQVEALREAAAAFNDRGPSGEGNGRAYNSYTVARILRADADRIAREAGIETADAPDCDTHNLVQHRDMKPPWCNKCGRDASGQMQRKEQDDA